MSTRDCIDRPGRASAVVVGRGVGEAASVATLWVIPGESLTAVAVPVWVEAGASPAALWQGGQAPLWRESLRIKRLLRPAEEGHKRDCGDLARLDNAAGTGYLPGLLVAEQEILARTAQFLSSPRTREEYAAFQREMPELALAAMRAVRQEVAMALTTAIELEAPAEEQFAGAKLAADAAATAELGECTCLAFFDRQSGRESPAHASECHGDCEGPGYEGCAGTRGECVFIYRSLGEFAGL